MSLFPADPLFLEVQVRKMSLEAPHLPQISRPSKIDVFVHVFVCWGGQEQKKTKQQKPAPVTIAGLHCGQQRRQA